MHNHNLHQSFPVNTQSSRSCMQHFQRISQLLADHLQHPPHDQQRIHSFPDLRRTTCTCTSRRNNKVQEVHILFNRAKRSSKINLPLHRRSISTTGSLQASRSLPSRKHLPAKASHSLLTLAHIFPRATTGSRQARRSAKGKGLINPHHLPQPDLNKRLPLSAQCRRSRERSRHINDQGVMLRCEIARVVQIADARRSCHNGLHNRSQASRLVKNDDHRSRWKSVPVARPLMHSRTIEPRGRSRGSLDHRGGATITRWLLSCIVEEWRVFGFDSF